MTQNLQLYRNSIDSNLFETKNDAIVKLQEKLSVANDGEIILARYKNNDSIETIFGIAVSSTNKSGYTIFEKSKEVSLGSEISSKNFLENEGINGEQVLAVREITTDATKTSKKIIVAGLDGTLGAGYNNGDVIEAGTSIDVILEKLLSKEIYPINLIDIVDGDISSSVKDPIIDLSDSSSLQEIGSSIKLNSVTCGELYVSVSSSTVTGLEYGYSFNDDDKAELYNSNGELYISGSTEGYSIRNSISEKVTSSITSPEYTLNVSFISFENKAPLSATNKSHDTCKITSQDLIVELGVNKIIASQTGPVVSGHADAIDSGYIVSNIGNTDSKYKYPSVVALNKELPRPKSDSTTIITGVYPCYNNISNGKLLSDASNKLSLQTGTTFTFNNVPSENANNQVFMFDFPATHSISSFKIKGPSGFADFTGAYSSNTTVTKTIQNKTVNYKRLKTSSPSQGVVTYEIKLNKALNQ